MSKWSEEAIIVYPCDGRWAAQIKRAPGVLVYGANATEAVADLAQLASDMDKSELLSPEGKFSPYLPCGSYCCGCCSPGWDERALSGTFTELAGEVQTISVPPFSVRDASSEGKA